MSRLPSNPLLQRNGAKPVHVQALRKSFGPQTVLDGIDLELEPQETLTILGRSGTGKSVFLKLIIGLQKPDSGSIRVHGQEITKLPLDALNEVRKKMGFLFQFSALYDSLTVAENVAFPLRRHTRMSPAEISAKVRALLSNVEMDEHLHKLPGEIAGGMQKRVALARALALQPDILLFDEPTAGLDPITAAEIDALIVGMREERKIASIVVTHDVHSARTISNRVALLNEGNIVFQGSFDELQKSRDPFVSKFLKSADS